MGWKEDSKARLTALLEDYETKWAAETAPDGWSWNEYQEFINERVESIHKLLKDLDEQIEEDETNELIATAEAQEEVISGGFTN